MGGSVGWGCKGRLHPPLRQGDELLDQDGDDDHRVPFSSTIDQTLTELFRATSTVTEVTGSRRIEDGGWTVAAAR